MFYLIWMLIWLISCFNAIYMLPMAYLLSFAWTTYKYNHYTMLTKAAISALSNKTCKLNFLTSHWSSKCLWKTQNPGHSLEILFDWLSLNRSYNRTTVYYWLTQRSSHLVNSSQVSSGTFPGQNKDEGYSCCTAHHGSLWTDILHC